MKKPPRYRETRGRLGPGATGRAGSHADGSRAAHCSTGASRPSVDDVAALARPVLTHRMALSFGARAEGAELSQVIDEVTARVTRIEAAA